MKILLTNDDGIQAKGLKILKRIIKKIYKGAEILIYAPSKNCTGAGRSMTFGKDKLVRVKKIRKNEFAVHGTPTDCVEIACRLHKIDLVFSGVNHGWNLGQDFYLSGTIQAALHAVDYFNVPAVALSYDKKALLYGRAGPWIEDAIMRLKKSRHTNGLISFNFPKCPTRGFLITKVGNFLAIGTLTPVKQFKGEQWFDLPLKQIRNEQWFDLLEPMNKLKESKSTSTDVGAIRKGYISVTLHKNAHFPAPVAVD